MVDQAAKLEVRLLGTFELRSNGRMIELPSRPAQSLFAFLILNAGGTHRRERLAGLLWPASTEESARNNLRQALWRLRKVLPARSGREPAYLFADAFTIGFNNQAPHWCDVAEMELVPDPAWPAERLMQIVDAYRGELLPGFYEDWVVLERERLRGLFERRVQMLLDRLEALQRWPEVIEWAERWIARGDVPEPAYRSLMIAHHALGDGSAASAAYQRCVAALRADLGVEPSSATQELMAQISSGGPVVGAATPITAPSDQTLQDHPFIPPFLADMESPAQASQTVFVGRRRERDLLMGFLRQSLSPRGLVVMVTGETGIGKTALLHQFAMEAQVELPTLLVASGNGNALTGTGDPYLPFRDVLGMLTGDVEAKWLGGAISGVEARHLWETIPVTATALVREGPDLIGSFLAGPALLHRARAQAGPGAAWIAPLQRLVDRNDLRNTDIPFRQKDLFDQVTKVLQAVARVHPLLLLLDDLQWADTESLNLLFHLARRIGDYPVLIVCASRPLEGGEGARPASRLLSEIQGEMRRVHGDIVIDLDRGDSEEAQTFVDGFLDTEPNALDSAFRQELRQQTSGHPLFTIELLRAMQSRGDLRLDPQGRWVRGPALRWGDLPARVEGVIEERLKPLDDYLLDILQLAAVVGEEFIAEVIARVKVTDVRQVVHQLSDRLDRQFRLVSALGSRRMAGARFSVYRFRHILFQRHLYHRLDAVQRAYTHEYVGDALESIYAGHTGDIAVILAHHFGEAGRVRKAVMYLQQAAEKARRLSAHHEAVGHLRRALALIDRLPEGAERQGLELNLQTWLGVSLIATHGYGSAEVEAAFTRARALCQGVVEGPALFPVLYGLRTFHLVRAEHLTATDLGDQLLRIAQSPPDPELLVEAHQAYGTTAFYRGEFATAKDHLERSLALYELERDVAHGVRFGQDPSVACQSYLAWAIWLLGQSKEASRRTNAALDHAAKVAHPFSMALALVFAGLLAYYRADMVAASTFATRAISLSAEQGFPFWLAMATMLRGIVQVNGGERAGIVRIEEGVAAWEQLGSRLGRPTFLGFLAEAHLKWGELDQAENALMQGLEAVDRSGERLNLAELHRLRGSLLAARGKAPEAEDSLRQAVEIAVAQQAAPFALQAALDLAHVQGGTQTALDYLRGVIDQLPGATDLKELAEAQGFLDASRRHD